MRERIRTILRWALPVSSFLAAAVWWLIDQPVPAVLGTIVGVLQLPVVAWRRLPLVVPVRRRPIVIEQLRWPRG